MRRESKFGVRFRNEREEARVIERTGLDPLKFFDAPLRNWRAWVGELTVTGKRGTKEGGERRGRVSTRGRFAIEDREGCRTYQHLLASPS